MTTEREEIRRLLDLFMEGQATTEQETVLAEYFRRDDTPEEFAEAREMFRMFDAGEPSFFDDEMDGWMQENVVPMPVVEQKPKKVLSLRTLVVRLSVAASIAVAFFFVGRMFAPTVVERHTDVITEVKWKTDTVTVEKIVTVTETKRIATVKHDTVYVTKEPDLMTNMSQEDYATMRKEMEDFIKQNEQNSDNYGTYF